MLCAIGMGVVREAQRPCGPGLSAGAKAQDVASRRSPPIRYLRTILVLTGAPRMTRCST